MHVGRKTTARRLTRRALLGGAAGLAAAPAFAEECRVGPPPHQKGPPVWLDYDQVELDAAYDQLQYAPLMGQNVKRLAALSEQVRGRLGPPSRRQYGQSAVEQLDIYRTKRPDAPVLVFVHGGAWLGGEAKNSGFPAELFVNAGAHFVALDFIPVKEAAGDLRPMPSRYGAALLGCTRMRRASVPTALAFMSADFPPADISAGYRW